MTTPRNHNLDEDAPVFSIAIAAELAQMHPQTLRQYDRMGLVVPERTSGRVRRYSLVDIAKLREISELSEAGVSLEGILRIVELRHEVRTLRKRMQELEHELAEERLERQRVFAAGHGEIVAISRGARVRARNEIVLWEPRVAARSVEDDDVEADDED
ncbi:heat shock protein transcriptional repressor HspR [Gulosibacter molinativorax]|uniref:MerR family DNA-binding transcriptional regulator n=1 Tax=Gulosibacter molinativorax TaxID=256821 RepID=A0ABT7C7H8_9MICO|nr:MerR family transcriptional regulator [Gulosibacter molinativorax]MDJ1370739.1 MerR family DNA-binding transcriptional regulator [Gulosibacter molinativorax]QUY63234.1 Putative heat shock protein HspR [Gulosibacter molinativorax]